MTGSRSEGEKRRRPSPSLVIAMIALFISLTGVGYALSRLPKNSVGSKQIKDGQVKSADVADNGLTGTDIDESTLNVPGAAGPIGPRGATGAQGATGSQGVPGTHGATGARGATGPPGPAGTSGQSAATVFSTAALSATGTFTAVPGLTQTVSVPSNASTYIAADGGILAAGGSAVVDVAIYVDGVQDGIVRRVSCDAATSASCAWSISHVDSLTAGSHTIAVRATQSSGAGTASVGGGAGSGAQGELTVMFLKQ